jgi:CRP-like cAMP-binding protein
MSHPLHQFFGQVPLFSNLNGDELNELLRAIQPSQIKQGEFLFREGDAADAAYVIQSGELEVFIERRDTFIQLTSLGPNDVLGEIALLDGQARTADVRAKTDVSLFRIDRTEFDFLRRNLHPTAYKLIKRIAVTVCERVRRSNALIQQLAEERDDYDSGRAERRAQEEAVQTEHEENKGILNRLAFWRSK